MSDISKKIFSIDSDGDLPDPVARDLPEPEIVLRRLDSRAARDPLTTRLELPEVPRKAAAAPISPSVFRPALQDDAPTGGGLKWAAIALSLLTLAALGLLAFLYVRTAGVANITPLGFAALALGVIVPPLAIVLMLAALRSVGTLSVEAARASRAADRLTRAHTEVPAEVTSMAQAIRAELTGVEARLEQSRAQVDGFAALLSEQGEVMDGTTKVMAERSETVSRALSLHRQAFESLATTFDAQMEAMGAGVDAQRGKLEDLTRAASTEMSAAQTAIGEAAAKLSSTAETVSTSSNAADETLRDAETRLAAMADRIARSAAELDSVYERRAEHLSSMADRMSGERDTTEAALFSQTEQLGAVDAQLEITEKRLTALVDHAQSIQTTLEERLAAIDSTLDAADRKSRDFTQSLSDRVTDSVATARRDLSLMEAELRALQARIDDTANATLDFEEAQAARERDARESRRIHLQPLESDFPPVEPRATPIKRAVPLRPAALAADPATAEPLDLTDALAIPDPAPAQAEPVATPPSVTRDVVRRPAEDSQPKGKRFGRGKPEAKAGWKWRDMLGGIDAEPDAVVAQTTAQPATADIVRPPAGVPLSRPATPPPVVPPAPTLPDGSDVVARLCEVQLAPSAVVDEGTIIDAGNALGSGGVDAMAQVVTARLRDPVTHLRGVLSADLEFKLRSESFCRIFTGSLSGANEAALRAELGSASGRAFLLCSAALRA